MEFSTLTRSAIDLFIACYLFVAWFWRHPEGSFGRVATEPLVPLVRWLGLGQNWSMFTPNPAQSGADLEIIIRRRSGAAVQWQPPRMQDLSAFGAFRHFRYRAYANAMMASWALPARSTLAHYLIRKYDFGDDPAVEVVYTWLERPIAPPGGTALDAPPIRAVFHRVAVPGDRR